MIDCPASQAELPVIPLPIIPLDTAAARLRDHLSTLRPGLVQSISTGLDGETLRPVILVRPWRGKMDRARQWIEVWGDRWDGWEIKLAD